MTAVLSFATVVAALLLVLTADAAVLQTTAPSDASIAIQTLITRREQMLDVIELADRLVVLGPESIAWYPRASALTGAAAGGTARITHSRPWPRDLRGRLRATAAGFDALLPGVVCRGTVQPFVVSCADESESWPLDIDNAGIMPSRNFFTTPEGLVFYGAAPLAASGQPRWLIADAAGTLAFLDGSRAVLARTEAADDVVRIAETCASGTYVITVAPASSTPGHDDLRLLRVTDTAVSNTATLSMPGAVVALWAQPGAGTATAIVLQSNGSRYEAHQISLACAR